MKLGLRFGINEPQRTINWWQLITDFPPLVLFKSKKWEFVMYDKDPSKTVDYICHFGEVQTYDPNFQATSYYDISRYIDDGSMCECGSAYSPFQWDHMRYCKLWRPW